MVRINGEIIPEAAIQYELTRLVKFYARHMSSEQVREQMPLLKEKAKDQAIGAKLLIAEADRLDIQVDDREVDAKLSELVKSCGGRAKFDKMIAAQGVPLDTFRQSLTRGCRVDKLVAKITEGAPEPTEGEMRAHYEAHPNEYRKPDRAQARHILVKPDLAGEAGEAVARSKIQEIRQQILDGASFTELATAHSECPSGQSHGGSLGWISRGAMVPEFDDVVFSMEIGKLSEVVETPLGFHIVEKISHEEGRPASYDEVRENIHEFLHHAHRGEVLSAHVVELKEKADIDEC